MRLSKKLQRFPNADSFRFFVSVAMSNAKPRCIKSTSVFQPSFIYLAFGWRLAQFIVLSHSYFQVFHQTADSPSLKNHTTLTATKQLCARAVIEYVCSAGNFLYKKIAVWIIVLSLWFRKYVGEVLCFVWDQMEIMVLLELHLKIK